MVFGFRVDVGRYAWSLDRGISDGFLLSGCSLQFAREAESLEGRLIRLTHGVC